MLESLRKSVPDLKILTNEPMRRHTSFQIGGAAELLVFPHSEGQVRDALRWAKAQKLPWRVMGKGSNLLAPDEGLPGLTIKLTELSGLDVKDNCLTAFCGVTLFRLANRAAELGLTGLQFAHGIPGSVGGAVTMNAGAYGGEISQVLQSSRYLDENGEFHELDAAAHDFGYRHSFYGEHPECVVISAVFALQTGDKEAILAEMDGLSRRRREKQPLNLPSAGSVFKRPEGQFAGTLIEQCGLKGHYIGGAQVSDLHAGFIVNTGGATCRNVLDLIEHIQEVVFTQTGIRLEPELRVMK